MSRKTQKEIAVGKPAVKETAAKETSIKEVTAN